MARVHHPMKLAAQRHAAPLLLSCFLALPCTAADLVGQATVIDGDTMEIHGTRIRLYGIDAPESGQQCLNGREPYRYGQRAALALSDHIGQHTVSCRSKRRSRPIRTHDRGLRGLLYR
jgi:endonuclease YncB( thermonuclease family)